jgi:hypothetical protein
VHPETWIGQSDEIDEYRKNLIRGPKCAPWKFYIRKIQGCSFWTPGSVLPHENMDKNEILLIQSIFFPDIKFLRGTFWTPSVDYSCHTCSFKFTQITGPLEELYYCC